MAGALRFLHDTAWFFALCGAPAGTPPEPSLHPDDPPLNIRAYLYLTITSLFWGGNSVAGKLAVGHVSPMALTTFRWTIALLLVLAFMAPQVRRDWPVIRRHWLERTPARGEK